jgi:hypothetical protein
MKTKHTNLAIFKKMFFPLTSAHSKPSKIPSFSNLKLKILPIKKPLVTKAVRQAGPLFKRGLI